MRISVIVPAYNEAELIGETLRHIQAAMAAFTRRGWETELIVCDNNSTDGSGDLARATGARVVFEPVNQIARARNTGAAAARGDWLVFVDADTHPGVELFAAVAEQIQSGRCLAGGCTVRMAGHHPLTGGLVGFWNCVSRVCHWLAGSFIFCEAAAFRTIGGFSQELFASEEIDLSKRLKKLARQTGREVVILHRHPILTSERKMHLYTLREHLRFIVRTIAGRGRTLTDRDACHTWYDGRR